MAGYEFSFSTTEHLGKEAKCLLRGFQFLGKELGLEVRYKTKTDNGQITCQVDVDGALESMQVLENRLIGLVEGKYRFERYAGNTREAKRYIHKVFLPMTRANKEALVGITGLVERVANNTRGTIVGAVATLQMGQRSVEVNEPSLYELIKVWDETRTKLFQYSQEGSKERIDQTILLDQAIETYLKSRLCIKSKTDFPILTDLAVKAEIIRADEKEEMDKFHTKRNKAQHENKPVDDADLYDYLVFLSQALNRFCS